MERYSRQMRVAGVGPEGQRRLLASRALIVGCGALGTHAATALVRAGVGEVELVDRDIVEWSNLQRQILFTEADARDAVPKAVAAAAHLRSANADCRVTAHVADCNVEFLAHLASEPTVVLDGTDNFATRYVLNDWCARHAVPWIYAGAVGTEGAAMVLRPGGPCLRCLWPEPPRQADVGNCETAGILAPAIAAVVAFQVAEAMKVMLGADTTRGVFTCDVWRGQYGVLPVASAPAEDCVVCRGRAFPALVGERPGAVTLCGRDAVQIDVPRGASVDLDAIAARLTGIAVDVVRTAHLLRFKADGCRFSVFPDGRTLVFGVHDPLRARALFDRWVGVA
ncbi:MAG: ThiF family adenylyltransferase [Planctomycetes bacterium]|nr:ThiF family adenylyltransferase [Planctomycetota bacterium]